MLNKAKYFIAGLLLSAMASQAQNAIVSGQVSGLKDGTVEVRYYAGEARKTEIVKVKDGKFRWVAPMPEAQQISIGFPKKEVLLFVESGKIELAGKADDLAHLKITGSKTQDEAMAFRASLKDLEEQGQELRKKYNRKDEEEIEVLDKELEKIEAQKNLRTDAYIASHPKSAFSVALITDRMIFGAYEELAAPFEKLDRSAQQSVAGKRIAARLEILKRSAIGAQMLDFTQNDTESKPVKFADFKGKYVFVDFWASWCHPCRAENPNVLRAYNQYKDKNFTVIGVSLDDKEANWKKAIKDDQMPWTQLSDLKGWKNEVSTYYGINGIPSTLLIDPQGRIIAKDLRGKALDQKLAELFN